MRKLLLVLRIVVIANMFVASLSAIYAQDVNFNRAYEDYVYNLDEYKISEAKYQLKRSEYLRHKTLLSKNESIDATKEFLKARDQVVIAYLTALRGKLEETVGMSGADKEPYFAKLDSEVSWHREHKDRLDTASNLDDLVSDSNESQSQYSVTQMVAYEALTAISTGKLNSLRGPLGDLISQVKSKISEIRESEDKDTSVVEKWVLDAENENTRSQEKIDAAKATLAEMKENQKSSAKRSKFNSSQEEMSEAHQHIKEANRFLGEIIIEIKTAD